MPPPDREIEQRGRIGDLTPSAGGNPAGSTSIPALTSPLPGRYVTAPNTFPAPGLHPGAGGVRTGSVPASAAEYGPMAQIHH